MLSRPGQGLLDQCPHLRPSLSPLWYLQSPGVMRKVESTGKVKAARIVSDKYRRVVSGPKRPVISKPTLIATNDHPVAGPMRTDIDGLPFANPHGLPIHDLRTFDDTATSRYAASAMTSLVDSPTASTSIPVVARTSHPRSQTHTPPWLSTSRWTPSPPSASTCPHEAEAVIQPPTRTTSVRSGVSGYSFQASTDAHGQTFVKLRHGAAPARARSPVRRGC